MKKNITFKTIYIVFVVLLIAISANAEQEKIRSHLVLVCQPDNDLYRVMVKMNIKNTRYDCAETAIKTAPTGSGVLILADEYPKKTVSISSEIFNQAAHKKLRLFIEFPSSLPSIELGEVRHTKWERVVITSSAFDETLQKNRIVMIHDCNFVTLQAENPHLVVAKIAGFDTAVYGLDSTVTHPILFNHPNADILVSTTKLSQFVTGRYVPKEAWISIWKMILFWLQPDQVIPDLEWTETVRPSFKPDVNLSEKNYRQAVKRGVDWYSNSRFLIDKSWIDKFDQAANYYDRVAPAPSNNLPVGNGSYGILEGFNSKINYDGTQPVRWYQRGDCTGETSMAISMDWFLNKNQRSKTVAGNLQDFLYNHSVIQGGPRANSESPSYGLLGWDTRKAGAIIYYGDDNARAVLGTLVASAALESTCWDEAALRVILANFRTSSPTGFREPRIEDPDLQNHGWEYYWKKENTHFAPHYQAWIWACYLWLYDKTKFPPLLDRTEEGIRSMMEAYPEGWRWTNGLQQERARMLLTLAWLIRVDDTQEHRKWLHRIADDLLSFQDVTGAIREEIGTVGRGSYGPPESNEKYGTTEAPLIQENGDPLADLLYTTNFAFFSLTEAAAATGNERIKDAVEKLADFLVRIQVCSEVHPELDGAWFRAFDFRRWEYWASNADAGWGAWSTETGWTQGWIVTMLAMQELKTNVWDFTADSKIADFFEKYREIMLPDNGD